MHLIVNDGMHRVYMALREWVIPQVVLVGEFQKTCRTTRTLFRAVGEMLKSGMTYRRLSQKVAQAS